MRPTEENIVTLFLDDLMKQKMMLRDQAGKSPEWIIMKTNII